MQNGPSTVNTQKANMFRRPALVKENQPRETRGLGKSTASRTIWVDAGNEGGDSSPFSFLEPAFPFHLYIFLFLSPLPFSNPSFLSLISMEFLGRGLEPPTSRCLEYYSRQI